MSNGALIILFVILMAPLSLAQGMIYSDDKPVPEAEKAEAFSGTIISTSAGDAAKGVMPEVMVKDDKGQPWDFQVKDEAPITGKDGNALTLNDLKAGDKIKIDYVIIRYPAQKRMYWQAQAITVTE